MKRIATSTSPVRLALRPEEAAASLGVSLDYFSEHIAHELPWVRRGRLKLVSITALEKWIETSSSTVLP